MFIEVVKTSKYGKNYNEYKNKAKLYKKVVEKALYIAGTFYFKY